MNSLRRFLENEADGERYRGFLDTFIKERMGWPVYDDWQIELFNYFIFGYPPGGFHQALFENDLVAAAGRTHVLNEWSWIVSFVHWLVNMAPPGSWGSPEKVRDWLALSKEERFEICHQRGWMLTDEELTWAKVSK